MRSDSWRRWLPWSDAVAPEGLRIFCLPHAGGSASAFSPWIRRYGRPDVAIHPVEYPGRGTRADEAMPASVEDIADRLADDLHEALAAGPFVLLGHSLGAMVGFRLAQRLEAAAGPRPLRLVLCGAEPPGASGRAPWYDLPRELLVERLRGLGGMAERAWTNPELVDVVLPIIRADLAVAETWGMLDPTPLHVPVIALAGDRDTMAPPAAVGDWRLYAAGPFAFRILDGDHFFLHAHAGQVLDLAQGGVAG